MNPANFFKITGDVVEVKITKANGDTIASNIRLTEEDLELFQEMKDMVMR